MQFGFKRPNNFIYKGQSIEKVETYKYLGHIINTHKSTHNKMPEHLMTQAQKALFALHHRTKPSFGYIPPSLAIKMFQTYILPILEYNNIMVKIEPNSQHEKIQIGYFRC